RDRSPAGLPRPRAAPADHRVEPLHEARHPDLHLHRGRGGAGSGGGGRRGAAYSGSVSNVAESDPSMLQRDFDEVRDITVIGAGPVGLETAFWAGRREASSRIIDSLPELGGQLTTLYPEKWIFDVARHPRA